LYTATNDEGDRFQISFPSSTTSDSLNYSSQRIIVSLAVDIPTGSRLSPYLAGGIGPAWVSIKSSNINAIDPCGPGRFSCPATFSTTGGTAIALAIQAKAGLAYFISPRSSLFIEAVYDYTSSVSVGNTELDDFGQYSAKFGFRYKL
jgi:opacity protein-like surface antigen